MTRQRKLRWTKDEDETLFKCIEKSPHNIMAGCRQASVLIGRNADSCKARFNYLRDKNPDNPFFITVGRKRAFPNRKVVKRGCPVKPQPVKKTIWQQIKSFFIK